MTLITGDPRNPRKGDSAKLILMTLASAAHDLNATATNNAVQWDTQLRVTSGYRHKPGSNPSRVTVNNNGWYTVGVNIVHTMATPGVTPYRAKLKLRKNGATVFSSTSRGTFLSGGAATNEGSAIIVLPLFLLADDYIEALIDRMGAYTAQVNPIAGESSFWMRYEGRN